MDKQQWWSFPISIFLSLSNTTTKSLAIFKFHLDGRQRDGRKELALLKISASGRDLNFFSLMAPDFRCSFLTSENGRHPGSACCGRHE